MVQKLASNLDFSKIQRQSNEMIKLLKLIKKICYKYGAQQLPPLSAARATIVLYESKQGDLVSNIDRYEQFDNLVTATTACGASVCLPGVTDYLLKRNHNKKLITALNVDELRL
eukprot:jgi/Psemu1/25345/gm1.25345_g